jgi:hypothetical protein
MFLSPYHIMRKGLSMISINSSRLFYALLLLIAMSITTHTFSMTTAVKEEVDFSKLSCYEILCKMAEEHDKLNTEIYEGFMTHGISYLWKTTKTDDASAPQEKNKKVASTATPQK